MEIVQGMLAGESIAVIAEEVFPEVIRRVWSDSQAAISQRETNVVGTKRGCVVSGKIFEKSANSGKRLENPGKTLERLGTCITQLFEDVRGFRSITKHAYILF